MIKKTVIFIILAIILGSYFLIYSLNYYKNNTLVIVRTVGERTENICISRLEKIFNAKNILTVKNITPLSSASKETFNLALQYKKKWLLVVDSDTLFFEDKIICFIKKASKVVSKDKNALCFQGLTFNKLSQSARMGGFYLYYMKNLKYDDKFYSLCKDKIRPEACIRDNIEKLGYNSYQSDDTVGISDFFQYPKDIVKKTILNCKKNNIEISQWLKNWQTITKDEDYKYILLGIKIYKTNKNIKFIPNYKEFDKYVEKYNIPSKNEKIDNTEVEQILKKYNNTAFEEFKKTPFVLKLKPLFQSY